MNILLIEDESRVADFVRRGLSAEGWSVDHAPDGECGLAYAGANRYDIVLLDLMLPGVQGVEVCRRLRTSDNPVPILMLTALDGCEDRVIGLRAGADDYLPKPFDFDELVARIEALHRRATGYAVDHSDGIIECGGIAVDRGSLTVTVAGRPVQMSKKERDLLLLFLANPSRVLSRERILNAVWGVNSDPLTNVVDVYVGRLRKKLGPEGERILTLRNVGYRLSCDPLALAG